MIIWPTFSLRFILFKIASTLCISGDGHEALCDQSTAADRFPDNKIRNMNLFID